LWEVVEILHNHSLRVCEKIATITGLADESVCPTLAHKGLRLGGAGAFACQPTFFQQQSRIGQEA
jgi:hypothetical protein